MTNLRVIKPTRRKPHPGDLFALQLLDKFLFGRVILADLPRARAPMPGSYLIYIYNVIARSNELPEARAFSPDHLLVPPLFINRLAWTKGYFAIVGHAEIQRDDLLQQHCFRDTRGRYLDEAGQILAGAVEPCGDWALYSYRYLDDVISDAIGIARAPECVGSDP